MPNIIRVKIDVSKIDKSRLFKGQKGTYLDITLLPMKELGKFGDTHMVVQDVSKEDREKGVKGAILGNAKEIGGTQQGSHMREPAQPRREPRPSTQQDGDDVPF